MQTECKPGNVYKHHRNGKQYVIQSICKHGSKNSNLPNVAIYYELNEEGWLYYRDVAHFNEVVTWDKGSNVWRYKYVGNLIDPDPNDIETDKDVIGYVNIKEGQLNIRDEYLVQFIIDNKDMIAPMHIQNERKRRVN